MRFRKWYVDSASYVELNVLQYKYNCHIESHQIVCLWWQPEHVIKLSVCQNSTELSTSTWLDEITAIAWNPFADKNPIAFSYISCNNTHTGVGSAKAPKGWSSGAGRLHLKSSSPSVESPPPSWWGSQTRPPDGRPRWRSLRTPTVHNFWSENRRSEPTSDWHVLKKRKGGDILVVIVMMQTQWL